MKKRIFSLLLALSTALAAISIISFPVFANSNLTVSEIETLVVNYFYNNSGLDGNFVIFDSETTETNEEYLFFVRYQGNSQANTLYAMATVKKDTGEMLINDEYICNLWPSSAVQNDEYKSILSGDFSSVAGTYKYNSGNSFELLNNGLCDNDISNGVEFRAENITKSSGKEYAWIPNGTYTWDIVCYDNGEPVDGAVCILYPKGVEVVSYDGKTIPTDTSKVRYWEGQDLVYSEEFIEYKQDITSEEEIKVILNGEEIEFDQPPVMINDRVMVPMRKIFEELGANVEWEDSTQTATAIRGVTFVKIAIDSNKLSITGIRNEDISLDSPAKLIDNRTYVPVRAVSEALDTIVSWNDDEQTVYISTFDGNKDVNAVVVNAESELTINDAALFRDVMLKNKVGNVYEENISVVTEPSETVFEVLIGKLVSLADDDDISYFFYTGHGGYGGANDSEAVIVPDYSSEHSATYEYTMSELIDCLSEIRGTVVIILDSCFSGAINDLNYDRNKFKILTACAANEYSFTENILSGIATIMFDDSVVNGKFSSVMLNGLGAYEGGGIFNKYNDKVKADENKDNKVTLAELYKYIDKNIDKTTKSDDGKIYTQTPTISDSDDQTVIYEY